MPRSSSSARPTASAIFTRPTSVSCSRNSGTRSSPKPSSFASSRHEAGAGIIAGIAAPSSMPSPLGTITDPRWGDAEDDASSTKSRSLIALAGSLLVEISWMKLLVAWLLLLVLPALILGAAPIAALAWVASIGERVRAPLVGMWSLIALGLILAIGWYGGRTLLHLGENAFWALNSAVVEPTYAVTRETLRHVGDELLLPKDATQAQHGTMRAV